MPTVAGAIKGYRTGFPVLLTAAAFAVLALFPYVLHSSYPSFGGLTVIRDKDFGNYYSRLERALHGHFAEAENGITPVGGGIAGVQIAGMERIVGVLFGWTSLPAPTLSTVLTPFFVFALFLLLSLLLRVLECTPAWSLGIAGIYFFILFHVLSRVVHPGWSFVPMIAALVSFFHFLKKPSLPLAMLAGFLLGILPFLYFWSFSFAWAVAGSMVAVSLLARRMKVDFPFLLLVCVTALIAAPFFLELLQLMQHPLYEQVALRGGFLETRGVESLPRSLLLAIQTGFFLSLFPARRGEWSYLAVLSLLLGTFIAMHQNIIHGQLLMFSSHFYPHLVLSSLVAGTWVVTQGALPLQRFVVSGIALLFLAGAAYDYLPGYAFFLPRESDFQDQHLLEPIRLLRDNGTSDVILTDAHTGRVLTAWTDEGIVYTTHARFLLVSDEEMAERYCLSELFSQEMPDPRRALYMEYNAVLDSPAMRERERSLVNDACERVRADPPAFLRKYGVTHVLWNQTMRPEWNITMYLLPLRVVAASDEWLLLALSASPET